MFTKTWHVYDKTTGEFTGETFSSSVADPANDDLPNGMEANVPDGRAVIAAAHVDHLSKKIDLDTGEVVDHVPPAPSDDHFWHTDQKRWYIKPEVAGKRNRHAATMQKIDALEAKQHRIIRDIFLNDENGEAKKKLHDIEDQIVELRKELA